MSWRIRDAAPWDFVSISATLGCATESGGEAHMVPQIQGDGTERAANCAFELPT